MPQQLRLRGLPQSPKAKRKFAETAQAHQGSHFLGYRLYSTSPTKSGTYTPRQLFRLHQARDSGRAVSEPNALYSSQAYRLAVCRSRPHACAASSMLAPPCQVAHHFVLSIASCEHVMNPDTKQKWRKFAPPDGGCHSPLTIVSMMVTTLSVSAWTAMRRMCSAILSRRCW